MGIYSDLVFPWMLDRLEGPELEDLRMECVSPAAGKVLEIGLGTGKTLPYYDERRVTSLTAVEPSDGMNRRVQKRLGQCRFPVRIVPVAAERLPFLDSHFDEVVMTMTLCSVADPSRVLGEIHRVLKPGGAYRFLEHVRSEDERYRRMQDRFNPVHRIVGCGCNLNRDTTESIVGAGFEVEDYDSLVSPGMPINPQLFPLIRGVARKGA